MQPFAIAHLPPRNLPVLHGAHDRQGGSGATKLGLDDSRALDSGVLRRGPGAWLRVSPDIGRLVGIDGDTVDLNAALPAFAAPSRARTVRREVGLGGSVAPSDRRYLEMPLLALLEEVAERAIGRGPGETGGVENPRTPPETRRLGDMVYTLSYQPGRRADAVRLHNAGLALTDFFPAYRALVDGLRASRPELEPVLAEWAAERALPSLKSALALPLDDAGQPWWRPDLYAGLLAPLQQPDAVYLGELDARLGELRRFRGAPLATLLEEVALCAIGQGPDDARPPTDPALPPERRRLDAMVAVLQADPGRTDDAVALRNTGALLRAFFTGFRDLVARLRGQRPDLAPVLGPWSVDLARKALQTALDTPGLRGRDFVAQEQRSSDLSAVVRQPLAVHVAVLEQLLAAQREQAFVAGFSAFFQRMSGSQRPGYYVENTIAGAAAGEVDSLERQQLRRGRVVFRCTRAQLAENLQTIPIATLAVVRPPGKHGLLQYWLLTRVEARYSQKEGGVALRDVQWQARNRSTRSVLVADRKGVHSFSTNNGVTWEPTGAPHTAALNDLRISRWEGFLTDLGALAGPPAEIAER